MDKIELLAPVGNKESFLAAINNGANAIYLAGTCFGAREKATFTNDEIKEMIPYAHIRGVKVHVTINTLIYDDEVDSVMKFVDFLYENDVDAIIVQDLGMINLIHKTYPDLIIHASTQLNTLNYKQAKVLKDLGVSRVILAREASLDDALKIKNELGLEVEVFAHGALCMGYSGQCLFSSFVARKSGNRGECLQLCRLPYTLYEGNEKVNYNNEYLLSCKDLLTLDRLNEFIDKGITSIKLEGRVKSACYVGKVVSLYRKYIDSYYKENKISVSDNDYLDLKKVFNREFSKGYIFNENKSEIVNTFRPNNIGVKIGKVIDVRNEKVFIKLIDTLNQYDGIRIVSNKEDKGLVINRLYVKGLLTNKGNKDEVVSIDVKGEVRVNDDVYKTSDYLLNKEIEKENNFINYRVGISVKVRAYIGSNLECEVIDDINNKVIVKSEFIVDKAINSPTSKERIIEQFSKLNESCYFLKEITIDSEEMIIIPISIINKLRNEMVNRLNVMRSKRNSREGKRNVEFTKLDISKQDFSYTYKVSNDSQYNLIKDIYNKSDIYYVSDDCCYSYPRISNATLKVSNHSVLINELNDIDTNKYMIANTYLNTTNIYTLYTLYSLGFKRVCLSLELSFERIKNMIELFESKFGFIPNVEVIVYGKIDLMITKYCVMNKILASDKNKCSSCYNRKFYLMDRKGYKLELVRDYMCNTRILNPNRLHLIEFTSRLKDIGVSKLRLEFTSESNDEIKEIISDYNEGNIKKISASTYGYFKEV